MAKVAAEEAAAATKPSEGAKAKAGVRPGSGSCSIKWPPVSSSKSLPPLSGRVGDLWDAEDGAVGGGEAKRAKKAKKKTTARDAIEFEVNQECTSIGLVPSGRLAVAGFTDGTLRLFDLTGRFAKDRNHPDNAVVARRAKANDDEDDDEEEEEALFDDDASSSSEDDEAGPESPTKSPTGKGGKKGKSVAVDSRSNQRYGAVACQIHARGVHTSLLMDVAVSEDGMYAFGGVQRGSVELAACYLGDVEAYLDEREREEEGAGGGGDADGPKREKQGLLDLIRLDRHADAKLKGFGACARLWNGWERARGGEERPEYLLFTGKGIKNIHIWSYKAPSRDEESTWTCLYDTPGNGTSINQLYFRHNAAGTLQAISKSDDQKLRVWDLSYEQGRIARGAGTDGKSGDEDRPRRPDYVDVASTEGTLGVCGPYAFASGSLGGMHNIINVVGLDADDVSSPFNRTELALPDVGGAGAIGDFFGGRPSRTGRQQRGDLKSVIHVAGLAHDAGHALLQLSDGSTVHYSHDPSGHPLLIPSPASLCATCVDDDAPMGPVPYQNRRVSLARVGSQGTVLLAVSSFNENTSRGAILLRALPGSGGASADMGRGRKYWGFNGLRKKRKGGSLGRSAGLSSPDAPSTATPLTAHALKASANGNENLQDAQSVNESDTGRKNSKEGNPRETTVISDKKAHSVIAMAEKSSRKSKEPVPTGIHAQSDQFAMSKKKTTEPITRDKPSQKRRLTVDANSEHALGLSAEKSGNNSVLSGRSTLMDPSALTTLAKAKKKTSETVTRVVKSNCPDKKRPCEDATTDRTPAPPAKKASKTNDLPEASTTADLAWVPPTPSEPTKAKELGRPSTNHNSGDQITPVTEVRISGADAACRKVTPGDVTTALTWPATANMTLGRTVKKRPSDEPQGMDIQLESIAQESVHSPKRPSITEQKSSLKGAEPSTKKQRTSQVLKVVDQKAELLMQKLPPHSSPRKRGGKKCQASPQSSPDNNKNDLDPAIKPRATSAEPVGRRVGFLGMTIVDGKKGEATASPKSMHWDHPPLLVERLPRDSVAARLAGSAPTGALEAATKPESSTFLRHSNERRALAERHRAEHERVRRGVLHSLRQVLGTWDDNAHSPRSHGTLVESAKRWFDEALAGHQEMLDDMLDRQALEAESLAATQTWEMRDSRPGHGAPMQRVSFPFPEVFDQAQQEMLSILK
ncbi:hypothetical protein ACHAWF_012060 [Thalassiosira exigua]